jgi:hypothetical protein
MDDLGDQFFPGSVFSGDEHGQIRPGDPAHDLIHFLHRRAHAHHRFELCIQALGVERTALLFQLPQVDRALQDYAQDLESDRLVDEVVRAELDGRQGGALGAVSSDDDDLDGGVVAQDFGQRREAFAGGIAVGGKTQIQQDGVGRITAHGGTADRRSAASVREESSLSAHLTWSRMSSSSSTTRTKGFLRSSAVLLEGSGTVFG